MCPASLHYAAAFLRAKMVVGDGFDEERSDEEPGGKSRPATTSKESTAGPDSRFLPAKAGKHMTQTRETNVSNGLCGRGETRQCRAKSTAFKKQMVVGDGCKNGGPFLGSKPSNTIIQPFKPQCVASLLVFVISHKSRHFSDQGTRTVTRKVTRFNMA